MREAERNARHSPWKQFTWGGRYVDDLVLRTRDSDGIGTLDETLYAVHDAGSNVVALSDTSGTIVERFKYDPYGRSTVLDGDFTADADGQSDYDCEYRFTSREFDQETGLHYFRARYYHDGLGRFISRDPLGYIDGAGLYAAYFVPGGVDPIGRCGPPGFGSPYGDYLWPDGSVRPYSSEEPFIRPSVQLHSERLPMVRLQRTLLCMVSVLAIVGCGGSVKELPPPKEAPQLSPEDQAKMDEHIEQQQKQYMNRR